LLKVAQALPPWRTAGARRAKAVLELAADEAERRKIRVGCRLDLFRSGGLRFGAGREPPTGFSLIPKDAWVGHEGATKA